MDGGANEEDVCEIIQLALGDVGLLIDVPMEAEIPTLIGPIAIASAFVISKGDPPFIPSTYGIFKT